MSSTFYRSILAFAILAFCSLPAFVSADTLFVSPSAGTYSKGQVFAVRIMVTSQSQAVNAVSAVLSFPTDKLQVASVSKIGSILNLWVEEPSFSNSQGTVSLEGVVPNPGFIGSNGTVLTVNFRVVDPGSATISFPSGSILANDGYGTNILRNKGTGTYTLTQAITAPAPTPTAPASNANTQTTVPVDLSTDPNDGYVDLNASLEEKSDELEEGDPGYISMESLETFSKVLIKILSILIPLIAIVFFLLHTMHEGVGNLRKIRKDVRKDLHNIDRLTEKSFDLLKENISESINTLERARRKRKLTVEEDAVIHNLRQNLVDAERAIHQEVLQAEKDLGD